MENFWRWVSLRNRVLFVFWILDLLLFLLFALFLYFRKRVLSPFSALWTTNGNVGNNEMRFKMRLRRGLLRLLNRYHGLNECLGSFGGRETSQFQLLLMRSLYVMWVLSLWIPPLLLLQNLLFNPNGIGREDDVEEPVITPLLRSQLCESSLTFPSSPLSSHSSSSSSLHHRLPFRVAFVGDSSVSAFSSAVLRLIRKEEAQLLVHLGDMDYQQSPSLWLNHINKELGEDFPLLQVMGNHDVKGGPPTWSAYSHALLQRWEKQTQTRREKSEGEVGQGKGDGKLREEDIKCWGLLGTQQACSINGVLFVISSESLACENHSQFIQQTFDFVGISSSSSWRICAWHQTRKDLQAEYKEDDIMKDIEVYETCRKGGALIVTAHAHIYSRTLPITQFLKKDRNSGENEKEVEVEGDEERSLVRDTTTEVIWDSQEGERDIGILRREEKEKAKNGTTVVMVVGTGGRNHRPKNPRTNLQPYWANIYSETEESPVSFGALFCDFYCEGKQNLACCYFKTWKGQTVDQFQLLIPTS